MVSKTQTYLIVLVVAAIALYLFATSIHQGTSKLAVQMTDPPSVPSGTQQLLVTYSSVEVHASGNGNQSGWVNASGSGTVDLMALTNITNTIASTNVAENSTINLVRFDITSARIVINGTAYNVTMPNSQINIAITGQQKINSSSSAVLVDLFPTVTARGSGSASGYVLVPAARAIVINSNSTVSIDSNVGSTASISVPVGARIGIGIGIGHARNNTNGTYAAPIEAKAGERVSNFAIQRVDYNSSSVSGLLYVEYPVANNVGVNTTLHINSTVGYACDNTEFKLTGIYANNTALFTQMLNTSSGVGGCPI